MCAYEANFKRQSKPGRLNVLSTSQQQTGSVNQNATPSSLIGLTLRQMTILSVQSRRQKGPAM